MVNSLSRIQIYLLARYEKEHKDYTSVVNRMWLALQLLMFFKFNWSAHSGKAPLEFEWDRWVVGAFKRRKSVGICVLILACFKKTLHSLRAKTMIWKTFTNHSLKKGGRHWTLAFCCIQVRIYSTININRPWEDWRKKNYGHKTLYIRVKYTMQHGEKKTITLHNDSLFGKWANKT